MCFMEGQGVDGHVGDDIFFFFVFIFFVITVQCSECQSVEKFKRSAGERQE